MAQTILKFVDVKTASTKSNVGEEQVRRWCRLGLVEARLTPGGGRWQVALDDEGLCVWGRGRPAGKKPKTRRA